MQLVLVSGLSGSGKSIALGVLEDSGYYCVDNLPATLLQDVVGFLSDAGHERVALSVDARSVALASLPEQLARLRERGVAPRLLFLEASAAALLRRYSETRRRHPLASGHVSLAEAIELERSLLAGLSQIAHRIDTSELQPKALRNWIKELLGLAGDKLLLVFESFAFRDGLPLDADWVVDSRMLPNPHYQPELRNLTGQDAAVAAFLGRETRVDEFLADLHGFLERWLPDVVRDNRSTFTVAIGCTGGRHRSVYLAERLAQRFAGQWRVLVRHRGLVTAETS